MDALTPMGRRFAGPPASMGAGSGDYQQNHSHPPPPPQNQQQGHYWYLPPSSTAPPGENQHFFPHNLQQQQHLPPPPMASGHFPPHPPPQYPHHQQQLRPPPWIPPSDHLQQFHQPPAFPPGVSPPLGMHFSGPPHAAVGSPLHHGAPPPNPPYPANRPMYPPHPTQSPYSLPNQMTGNPSWHGTQGWNYTDPNFQYDNGEDWGARAREWAAANSSTEVISSFGPPNNVYNDQYQNPKISSTEEHLPDSRVYPHGRLSNFQEPSLNSTSFDAGDGATATETSVASSTPVNVQEVPSSYSSFSGNREATDMSEELHFSIPRRLQVPSNSPHSRGEHSVEFMANTEQARVLNQSPHLSSVHGYAQAAGPVHVPLFPHVTPVRPGPQFEPPSISSSLSGQPQVFGRIQQPNFQAHLGFDVGSHPTTAFHADSVEAFNLSERPKKAAVPNWLKDEIIKKKASIVGSTQEQPNGNSHSAAAQVHGKDSQKGDPRKIIDSPRTVEDEEDDEDDADAARLAAINQEIKRVLTDVLLKVTDELFEEIATKVLDEDEPEADHKAVAIKHRDSTLSPSVTPKASANVFLTSAPDRAAGEGGISSTGGAILGLADYSSSDDDDGGGGGVKSEGIKGVNLPSSDKVPETSLHLETADLSSEGQGKREKGPSIASEEFTEVPSVIDGSIISHVEENKLGFTKSLESGERGNYSARKDLEREKSHVESDLASGHSNNGKSTIRNDDPVDKKTLSHKNFVKVHEPTVSRRGSKDPRNDVDDRKSSAKDRRDRPRDDDGRKREKTKDEREERFRPAVKDLHKQKMQHISQPSAKVMVSGREGSFDSASASGDEVMESSRKRKLQSRRESLSPSLTRSRRHVLRSPHSKHSQRRHSPHSHSDSRRRRSRSRSSSPEQRRRSGHRR